MDCPEATERLPWLIAGSLDAQEADEVRRHLDGCAACRTELHETRQAAAVFGAHLPAAAIIDLAWDRRPEGLDPALARAHVGGCAECRDELALARESRVLHDDARDAGPARRRRWTPVALPATLAAGLAVGVLWGQRSGPRTGADRAHVSQLESEVDRLRRELAEASAPPAAAPRLNVPVFELLPSQVSRGATEPPPSVIALPAAAAEAALIMGADVPAGTPATLAIEDARGREVFRSDGLLAVPPGGYVLTVPAALVPDGDYVLRLAPRQAPPVTYRVRVQRAR